jgi:integrase
MPGHYSKGSVTKARGKWRGQILYTAEDGSRQRLSEYLEDEDGPIPCDPRTNRGKNRALAALDRWRSELIAEDAERSGSVSGGLSGVTVSEYLDSYIDGLMASKHVEPSTIKDYRTTARRIKAALGERMVSELTRDEIAGYEASMMNDEGLSPRTVTKVHRLLSQSLRAAVDAGRLPRNPCDGVRLPKTKKEQPHSLTKEGAMDLLGTLSALPQVREVSAARIALCSGMRLGEVCALQWKDVDPEELLVRVTKSLGNGTGGTYVKTPKNAYSVREIPMTPQLEEAFQARRKYVLAEAEKAGAFPTDAQMAECYVLGDLSGEFVGTTTVSRGWTQLRRLLNLTDKDGNPLRFHDLRHTYATLAVQAGVDIKSLSSILGHADASMTLNIYASSDSDARRLAAEKLGAFMGETRQHGEVREFPAAGTE